MGRLDWWNLKDEHTPFQWALQIAMSHVQPYGERRQDMRSALMTANLMAMQMTKVPDDADFSRMVESLRDYLRDAEDYEDEDDIEAARLIARKDG